MEGRGSGAERDGFAIFGNPFLSIGYKALAVGPDPEVTLGPFVLWVHKMFLRKVIAFQ